MIRWTSPVRALPPLPDPTRHPVRRGDPRGRPAAPVVPVGQPGRADVRRPDGVRRGPAQRQPDDRLRRRRALLPRVDLRPPGAAHHPARGCWPRSTPSSWPASRSGPRPTSSAGSSTSRWPPPSGRRRTRAPDGHRGTTGRPTTGRVVDLSPPGRPALRIVPDGPGSTGTWPEGLAAPVVVVTAWNPDSVVRADEENRRGTAVLAADLAARGLTAVAGHRPGPVDGHHEEGVAVPGLDADGALALGRRHGQAAVYVWTPEAWQVVSCTDDRHHDHRLAPRGPRTGRARRPGPDAPRAGAGSAHGPSVSVRQPPAVRPAVPIRRRG